MQKIIVEITAKGYTGLTAENIQKALDYYFGSPTLKVSFSVEAVQHSAKLNGCTCGTKIGLHVRGCALWKDLGIHSSN